MTVQDDPVMALRIQLYRVPCPVCGAHELKPELRCDYYPDGCLWLVRCKQCETQYHLDDRSMPVHVTVPPMGAEASPLLNHEG